MKESDPRRDPRRDLFRDLLETDIEVWEVVPDSDSVEVMLNWFDSARLCLHLYAAYMTPIMSRPPPTVLPPMMATLIGSELSEESPPLLDAEVGEVGFGI
jgi:hypothetical protein